MNGLIDVLSKTTTTEIKHNNNTQSLKPKLEDIAAR